MKMKKTVDVDVTVNQLQLMYAWTFRQWKPTEMSWRDAADKVMDANTYWMIDHLIRESKRVSADWNLYSQEMEKFQ
tara:strand:- start:1071 stop:1298 length:228 start_codon:yes stop_codon:yes gene_type:complete